MRNLTQSTDKRSNPTPDAAASDQLRTAQCHQITIENGGYMRFSGFTSNNRITAIYSEKLDPNLAAFTPYGVGCPATLPLGLAANGGTLPIIGQTFTMDITNVPASAIGTFMGFGFVQTAVDLSSINAFGCSLYHTLEVSAAIPTVSPTTQFSLPIPPNRVLSGSTLFAQAFVLAPLNPLGLITTNGGEMTIGF